MSLPFCPRRGARQPPALRRAQLPPLGFSEQPPPVRGEHAYAVRTPRWVSAAKKGCRPERANTLTQFACPGKPMQEKEPPRQGEHANVVRVPRWVGAEKEPPVRGEHANAVRAPRSAGAEKEPPRQGEHADAVRAPRSAGAENPGNPEKIFPPEKAAKTPILTPRKRLSKRYS